MITKDIICEEFKVMKKKSRTVPKEVKAKYEEITEIIKEFCEEKLNDEFYELACDMCAAMSRKRPSPLLSGRANTWACGIIHALGAVNFLFDPSQDPHMPAGELYESFGISSNTARSKSKIVWEGLKLSQMDPEWTLPSKIEDNPFVWMIMVDGMVIDARQAPIEIQEAAFAQGVIPYIPGEGKEEKRESNVIEFPNSNKTSRRKSKKSNIEHAYELISRAFETNSSKKRINLASEALELWEDCTEAYLILASDVAKDLNEARNYLERGLEAAKRNLGEKVFEEDMGFFWINTETRPYMTVKWHLAGVLWEMNERKEAINHLKEMLILNKNDNQGVRYILVNWLLEEEDYEALEKLFKDYEDDAAAAFSYSRALFYYKKDNKSEALKKLKEAFKQNPHVPEYILSIKKLPANSPEYIGFGDETEAQEYTIHAFEVWLHTIGALEWMRQTFNKRR